MKHLAYVLLLLFTANAVAGTAMLVAGKMLDLCNPQAGWMAWTVVGVIGILASVVFLRFVLDYKGWTAWPNRR